MSRILPPDEPQDLRLCTLAQLAPHGDWRITLAHDRGHHLLIWTTAGQGRALAGGARRGIGTHNALFIPAGTLMALQPGRTGMGLALMIPPGLGLPLPEQARHLRIRDAAAQNEIAGLLDALGREQAGARARWRGAMAAHGTLVAIWLRRQLAEPDHAEPPETAARALSQAYCAQVAVRFACGETVADHARTLGVSAGHLTLTCRAQTGQNAAALLNDRRLHAARCLLEDTDAPISGIARHLGFSSPAMFSRFIRRHTGSPPSALRRPSVG